MSEAMQLRDPLYKLLARFSNGEMVQYVMLEPIEARMITPETRYAVISSFSCQNPSECTEVTVLNLRDVTYFKTEQVTLEQLATERRMAGMRAAPAANPDDRLPKTLAQLRFI